MCTKDKGLSRGNHKAQTEFLTFSGCFCRMLKGSGDGEAEGMLTRAPPDHQATCFNIHDITSSLGGPGLHGNEAARSGLLSLEEDRLCLSLSLCRSLSLSQQ